MWSRGQNERSLEEIGEEKSVFFLLYVGGNEWNCTREERGRESEKVVEQL